MCFSGDDDTAATASNRPGAQRCLQRTPTLQTRVNVGMRGPAYSPGCTKSTHLSAPAAELGQS